MWQPVMRVLPFFSVYRIVWSETCDFPWTFTEIEKYEVGERPLPALDTFLHAAAELIRSHSWSKPVSFIVKYAYPVETARWTISDSKVAVAVL